MLWGCVRGASECYIGAEWVNSVPTVRRDYAEALEPRKTWCILGNEIPSIGLSLVANLG